MTGTLVRYWISVATLLATPIAPDFAEYIRRRILHHPTSIQLALWPTPTEAIDTPTIEVGAYMRTLVKNVRDAELMLLLSRGVRAEPREACGGYTRAGLTRDIEM